MGEFLERINKLSPKRLALLALELHKQVEAAKRRDHEPIAVIGMGCRFPGGASDPDSFWDLLVQGRDAINKVPSDRWDIDALFDPDPDAPGRISVRHGGFLEKVDDSIQHSSESRRAKHSPWIPSSVCCSRSHGRRWNMLVFPPSGLRARRRAFSSEFATATIFSA